MKFPIPALCIVLGLAACLPPEDQLAVCECQMNWETVSQDDDSMGFTAADVLALLEENLPTQIVWDDLTLTSSEDDVRIEIGAIGGDVQVARGPGNCCLRPQEPALGVPVTMTVTIGGGEVVAQGVPRIIAYGLSLDDIYLDAATDWPMPAALSGAYASAEASHFAEVYESRGFTQTGTYFSTSPSTPWLETAVDIDVTGVSPDSGLAAAFWRGHWQ